MSTEPRVRRYAKRLPAAERREQLLDAALRVLVRDGYAGVTVEAVAREAGVTRPVVYAAYDGLEPLLHALLDRSQRRGLESAAALLPRVDETTDVRSWLLAAMAGLLDVVRREPEVWRPILGLIDNPPPVVRDRIARTREHLRGQVAGTLERGLAAEGRTDVDTDVLSHLVVVTAEQFARMVLEHPRRYRSERLVAALEALLAVSRT